MESLAGQLREEKDLRADADKEIERTLREHNQALEKRLRATSDQLSQLERDMADRLTQEAQSLREEIKRKNEDLQHAIEKMFAELSNVKTDRNLPGRAVRRGRQVPEPGRGERRQRRDRTIAWPGGQLAREVSTSPIFSRGCFARLGR